MMIAMNKINCIEGNHCNKMIKKITEETKNLNTTSSNRIDRYFKRM